MPRQRSNKISKSSFPRNIRLSIRAHIFVPILRNLTKSDSTKLFKAKPIGPFVPSGLFTSPSRWTKRCRIGNSIPCKRHISRCKDLERSFSTFRMMPPSLPVLTLVPSAKWKYMISHSGILSMGFLKIFLLVGCVCNFRFQYIFVNSANVLNVFISF